MNYIDLAEQDIRRDALKAAKVQALKLIAPTDRGSASWWIHTRQWKRFRASRDPLTEYREETEQFVAGAYNRIRRSQGRRGVDAYRDEIGRYHEWWPPRWFWQRHPYAHRRIRR